MTQEVIALIDRLIEEHKIILQNMDSLESVVNDAGAIISFDKAKEIYMPGRLDSGRDMEKLHDLLDIIDQGLRAHFEREEAGLHAAFEQHGGAEMATTFHSLLMEHDELRNRLTHHKTIRNNLNQSLKEIGESGHTALSRQTWEATANDIRVYIIQSKKLVEEHAGREHRLFTDLRKTLATKAGE